MAFVARVVPYEILIRLGPDGYQAAHVVNLEQLVDDETDVVRTERELPAAPISVENAGTILGEANAMLLAQIEALTAALLAETDRANRAELALAALSTGEVA